MKIIKTIAQVQKVTMVAFCSIISVVSLAQKKKSTAQKIDSVLSLMSIDEKIGQLNQYSGDWSFTGPITQEGDKQDQIRKGMVGSMLNVTGVEHTRALQHLAMQSRLKIPLLFGQDVIHGFRTTFPIPLAQACSWDLKLIEEAERVAATESAAYGIHWTFAPMVDLSRDPRWGRVMEGSGEDSYLGARIAAARVRGFQGKGLGDTAAVMACVKHFAAYGAAVGGRDYNSVDMSERQLQEFYLPAYRAAVEAGAATVMTSFNDLNGVPATANEYLLKKVLRDQWKFKGMVVSDWGSVGEMINHGFASDTSDAALKALNAGCDMDMESRCYRNSLKELISNGKIKVQTLDEAVRHVLQKKFELGLFDDPFKFCNPSRQAMQENNQSHKEKAHMIAKKSIVLLKNTNKTLPISSAVGKIAFVGPFVTAVRDNLGFWSMEWPDDSSTIVSQWDGLRKALPQGTELTYAKGCGVSDFDTSGFAAALAIAKQSDLIILSLGEARDMSGEAKSRSRLRLPGVQELLIKAMAATGKPVVLLINAGRPLIIDEAVNHAHAVLYTWWLGSEAGNAIAEVLTGKYNPSGKITMSFPRSEGQIPVYYNHFNTGRPASNESDVNYVSAYTDLLNTPAYPFGFGLSYTDFVYTDLSIDKKNISRNDSVHVTVTVTNTGLFDGTETVQLYIRDRSASLVRPVKELRNFQQIFIKKGDTQTLHFFITESDLQYYKADGNKSSEPGIFDVFIGNCSTTENSISFRLLQ